MKRNKISGLVPRYVNTPEFLKMINALKRKGLYLIKRKFTQDTPQLVLFTHFYKTGLRFKPISERELPFPTTWYKPEIKPFTISWENVSRYELTQTDEKEIPLFINKATPYLNEFMEGRNDHDSIVYNEKKSIRNKLKEARIRILQNKRSRLHGTSLQNR